VLVSTLRVYRNDRRHHTHLVAAGATLRKTSCIVLTRSRTRVRLPSLLLHTLPIVDACQSGYGRPVVLAVRAYIYEVVFRLSYFALVAAAHVTLALETFVCTPPRATSGIVPECVVLGTLTRVGQDPKERWRSCRCCRRRLRLAFSCHACRTHCVVADERHI
jgi:hypothetical protein